METILIAIIGAFTTWITNALQKKYDVSARMVLIILAILTWVGYQLFMTFVPEETRANVIQFILWVLWTAFWIHEFLVKPVTWDPIRLGIATKPKEERWGARERENDEDWRFGEDTPWPQITPEELPPVRSVDVLYHQTKEWWLNTCTIVASAWAYNDQTNTRFNEIERATIVADALNQWYNPEWWRYTDPAVKLVKDKVKQLHNRIVYYIKFPATDRATWKLLTDKWYRVIGWYRGNASYNRDRDADGVVESVHPNPTYGHLIRYTSTQDVTDNYVGRTHNLYVNTTIDAMLQENLHHNWCYVYFEATPTLQEKIAKFQEYQRQTKEYLIIKWPSAKGPKRIDKGANRMQQGDKKFVVYKWQRHEYVLPGETFPQ